MKNTNENYSMKFVYIKVNEVEVQALKKAGVEFDCGSNISEADIQALENDGFDFDCFGDDDYLIRYEHSYEQEVEEIISNLRTKSFGYDIVNEDEVQALQNAGIEFYFRTPKTADDGFDYVGDGEYSIQYEKEAYSKRVNEIIFELRTGKPLYKQVSEADVKEPEYKEVSEADVQALKNASVEFDCVVDSSGKNDYIIRYEKAISQQVQKIISNSLNNSLKRWYN